jgi:hypothetical protein
MIVAGFAEYTVPFFDFNTVEHVCADVVNGIAQKAISAIRILTFFIIEII